MKNYFSSIFSLFVLLLLFSFFSCQQEIASGISNQITDLRERLERFNEGKLPVKQGELLQGEAVLLPKDNNEITIAVQDKAGKTYLYTLQSSKKIHGFEFQYFKDAQVLFLRNSVIINATNTPERILLSIHETTIRELSDLQFTKKLAGYGLSRTTTTKIPSVKNLDKQEIAYLVDTYTCVCPCRLFSIPDTDCQAGGSSSTSCSISKEGSSCSTECSGSYYACCKCTKDNPE